VEPEFFNEVTIFFSDIIGYTDISSTMEPTKVMAMLDRMYQEFDSLTRTFGLFKVETIGDA
jgi:class 3 adenylate cyclase